ncbi:MAG: T9SS type A sorting domain-containing protein [Chitinophagales bacterium]
MNVFRHFAAVVIMCLCTCFCLRSQTAGPPFSISLEEITWSDWPALHSFAFGKWDGRWLIMSGRTGGLHGFLPPNPFPVTEANNSIEMLDPVTGEQWSSGTLFLDDAIRDQLRSTNTEFFQRDQYLYIIGGYGKDTLAEKFITFPSLIAVDLQILSDALINATSISGAFRQISDTLFCVTGGEVELLNDKIYLFGGHVFTGEYTKPASDAFIQTYTNELRKFVLDDDGVNISVSDIEQIKDTANFHRRDLNFEPVIFPGEEFALGAFSGVFQYEADWVWFNPVYITDDNYDVDLSVTQKLNAYNCPVMSVYDSVSQNYYATFFGGIAQFYHDEVNDTIKEDLNVPFINDISTIIKYADGTTEQFLEPVKFDALLGSNAIFVLNEDIPQYENKVIQLHRVDGDIMAGYIFGGIDAQVPNFTPSVASNRLFKVMINYENPLPIEEKIIGAIGIYPNPVDEEVIIKNGSINTINSVEIINDLGVVILEQKLNLHHNNSSTINLSDVDSGFYFLKLNTSNGNEILKMIKL